METTNYVLVIAPLVGVVIGGFIASAAKLVELHFGWKTDRRRIQIQKLESAAGALVSYAMVIARTSQIAEAVYLAGATPQERLREYKKSYWNDLDSFKELATLLDTQQDLELRDSYEHLVGTLGELDQATISYVVGANMNQIAEMLRVQDEALDKMKELSLKLVSSIENLQNAPILKLWFLEL